MRCPKRILIIDDEPDIREIAKLSLQITKQWEVLTAASGLEGTAIAAAAKPDAILLDVIMPGLDGLGTLRKLKMDPETSDIPVILLTATAKLVMQSEYSDCDTQGILIKPFDPGILGEQIEKVLAWQPIQKN